jgi:hypothetical protein
MASGAFYIPAIAGIRLHMFAIQITMQSQSPMTFTPVDGKLDIRRDKTRQLSNQMATTR